MMAPRDVDFMRQQADKILAKLTCCGHCDGSGREPPSCGLEIGKHWCSKCGGLGVAHPNPNEDHMPNAITVRLLCLALRAATAGFAPPREPPLPALAQSILSDIAGSIDDSDLLSTDELLRHWGTLGVNAERVLEAMNLLIERGHIVVAEKTITRNQRRNPLWKAAKPPAAPAGNEASVEPVKPTEPFKMDLKTRALFTVEEAIRGAEKGAQIRVVESGKDDLVLPLGRHYLAELHARIAKLLVDFGEKTVEAVQRGGYL